MAPGIAAMLAEASEPLQRSVARHPSQLPANDNPWDWVRTNVTWDSKLIDHGWQQKGKMWSRPGKTPREGTGAYLHDDGRFTFWTQTGLPPGMVELGHLNTDGSYSISLADFITAYEFGGDRHAFGQEYRKLMPPPSSAGRVQTTGATPPDISSDENASADALDGGSWSTPVDLTPILDGTFVQPKPTILERTDGVALFYPGTINGIHGESGLGKGWVALTAAAEQIRLGHAVVYLDLEDTLVSIASRLQIIGLTVKQITEHLIYLRPDEPTSKAGITGLVALIDEHRPTLVIIDSLGEAFGLDGIDENSDAEVAPWLRQVPRRLADAGPCVIVVDHVTKALDNPLYQKGSGRKRGAVGGAQYFVEAVKSLVQGGGGRLRLTTAKDRNGTHTRGAVAAEIIFAPSGFDMIPSVIPPRGANDGAVLTTQERFDQGLIECALDLMKAARRKRVLFTKTALCDAVDGHRAQLKRAAFEYLVERGQLIEASKGKFKPVPV
jgi:hypothetical protein